MKFSGFIAAGVIAACLTTASVYAVPNAPGNKVADPPKQQDHTCKWKEWHKKGNGFKHKSKIFELQGDPVKALENKKKEVQSLLKEGKITKEKADAITARIDNKIKAIQEFNKLPLPQKKEKLINDFKERINAKVKNGKLSQDKADELLKKFTEEVEKWDGKGYPNFNFKTKGFRGKKQG